MRTINLEGLPEDVARTLEKVVEALRDSYRKAPGREPTDEPSKGPRDTSPRRRMPSWSMAAPPPDQLRREEIYKDVV